MDFVGNSLDLSLHYLTAISAKQKLTSANIANAQTPGYTAREMSFAEVLKTENPFETDLSQRMGSKLSEMNNNSGLPVDLQKELVEMQKNLLFYSMTTRRAASVFNSLKNATQVGR
ncbi:flagellar basal body rod protein FlgB [Vampirovibrio sp.]|uniref:flagellar basal body rod protein FlgB n=1 Tax=Vampirovibrio sp. TaxID=2717857 RepID=UPI003593E668